MRFTRKSAIQINEHRQSLLSLCRICAKLLSRRSRRQYSCHDHAEAIQGAFDVDVATDQAELHPPSVCEQCWMIAKRWKTAQSTGRLYRPIQKAVLGKIMTAAVCVLHAKRAAKMQRVDVLRLSGQRFRADLRKTAWKL